MLNNYRYKDPRDRSQTVTAIMFTEHTKLDVLTWLKPHVEVFPYREGLRAHPQFTGSQAFIHEPDSVHETKEAFNAELEQFRTDHPIKLGLMTPQGLMIASAGEWVFRDSDSWFYKCGDEVFKKTFGYIGWSAQAKRLIG